MIVNYELSEKQAEYIKKANKRWNGKVGATQCGKTFVDTLFVIPDRVIKRTNSPRIIIYYWCVKRNYTKKCNITNARNIW